MLCLVRCRPEHTCDTAVFVVVTVLWDGIGDDQANDLYAYFCAELPENGKVTDRRCAKIAGNHSANINTI